jgi:hypothetical protein
VSLALLAIITSSASMSAYAQTIQPASATIHAATDPVAAESARDWIVPAETSEPLKANYHVPLKNRTERDCLVYKERRFGINLGWSSACAPNISFVRQSLTWDEVHYGERLAIYVANHGYLRYRERTYGINLVWSDKPVFEWEIQGSRDVLDGDVVRKNTPFAIYNHVERDHVIYCERSFGINLRWADDCHRTPSSGNDQPFRMRICRDNAIPAGYIVVNDHWDPTRCGRPTSVVYNVVEIVRYKDMSIGSHLAVCAYAPTPPGWVKYDGRWDPTACSHPISIIDNIQYIKRIS